MFMIKLFTKNLIIVAMILCMSLTGISAAVYLEDYEETYADVTDLWGENIFESSEAPHPRAVTGRVKALLLDIDNPNQYLEFIVFLLIEEWDKVPDELVFDIIRYFELTEGERKALMADLRTFESRLRREIIKRMIEYPGEYFLFSDKNALKINMNYRLHARDMMTAFNEVGIYGYARSDEEPSTNAPEWKPARRKKVAKDGRWNSWWFVQYKGNEYDGILSLCDKSVNSEGKPIRQTLGECEGAIIACHWYGEAMALGKESFNEKYDKLLSMVPGSLTRGKNIRKVSDFTPSLRNIADRTYFKNYNYRAVINNDLVKRRNLATGNLLSGENAMVVDFEELPDGSVVELYSGLGSEYHYVTEERLRDELRMGYNANLKKAIDQGVLVDNKRVVHIEKEENGLFKEIKVAIMYQAYFRW